MRIRSIPWPALLVLTAVSAAGAGSVFDSLAHFGPGRPVRETAVLAPDVTDAPRGARATGVLKSRPLTLAPDGDRGSRMTDAGAGLAPLPLTNLESAKLDLARDAITAAEAAGTRAVSPTEVEDAVFTPEELDAIKRQQASVRVAAALAGASGQFGQGDVPTRVLPEGPSEQELQKLREEGLR
jgi:nucleotide-binding universal stress UspA family protein